MHILIISQHYWPETVGTARRAWTLAEYLVGQGHFVEVLAGRPNHPSMEHQFNTGHEGLEQHNGVDIRRLPVYRASLRHTQTSGDGVREGAGGTRERMTPLARAYRMMSYGSWLVQGVGQGVLQALLPTRHGKQLIPNPQGPTSRPDLILAISPLPTGVIAAVLAQLQHIPLVFDLQDIWPEAIFQAGVLKGHATYQLLEALEEQIYARAAALVVLSEGFKARLVARGIPAARISVISNGVDATPYLQARDQAPTWRSRLGYAPDDTVVIYAGNLGLVQDLDVLLDAAAGLKHVRALRFLLVGEGVERERLRQKAEGLGLAQVRFLDHQSADKMPALLMGADVCFLSLKPGHYMPGTVPSKLFDYLMAGRPIINMVGEDTADLLDRATAGINLPTGDTKALRVALFALHADPALRQKMGLAGHAWALKNAAMPVIGAQYAALLATVGARGETHSP